MNDRMPAAIFSLTRCENCRVSYAVCPDPANRNQILVFDVNRPHWPPLAIAASPMVCHQCGADVTLTEEAAVLSANAAWLGLSEAAALAAYFN